MRFSYLTLLTAALVSWGAVATAADVPVKFTLDWKPQGPHAFFYLAKQKGYFKAEGLDVTIDHGSGSAEAVTRIATGAYDAGFGDINAVIQAAALSPSTAPVMVSMLYNRAPFAIITKANGPIRTLKDLENRSVGTPPGSTTLKLLPVLASKAGVDATKIKVVNAAPQLIEQLLVRGDVDAIAQFAPTSYMNLVAMNLNPDADYKFFFYSDLGVDLYSNGVMVSQKLAKNNPEAVRGLLRAIHRAVAESIANPDAAMAVLKQVEPLVNTETEKRRLTYFFKQHMRTEEALALGLGDIDDKKLDASINSITSAFELKSKPKAADVFNRSFLPPRASRSIPQVSY
jgi:NitT/TauT family transport system substrate-binding protein